MGSPDGEGFEDEHPQHNVRIKNAFAVGVAPVTRGEFAAFISATNYKIETGARLWNGPKGNDDPSKSWRDPGFRQEDDHPVVCVSWHDVRAYVAWLREQSGGNAYRLLSEAEWEYCCRARTESAYSTGKSITPAQANFGRHVNRTTSVFKFPPNAFGLHDMHGNVWEWCEDTWHKDYYGNPPPRDGSTWGEGSGLSAFCAAVPILPFLSTSARPTAAGTVPASATTESVSVLPKRLCLLPLSLLRPEQCRSFRLAVMTMRRRRCRHASR